jgi:addiction module RelB/DinJ family antitoxin
MASKKTVINIKADKAVKERAQEIAERMGIPLSTVINAFLRQFIRTEEVTFSAAYTMTPKLEAELREINKHRVPGKDVFGPFNTAEEAIKWLSGK